MLQGYQLQHCTQHFKKQDTETETEDIKLHVALLYTLKNPKTSKFIRM